MHTPFTFLVRKNRKVDLSADDYRLMVYEHVRLHSPKAYVRLHTSLGDLNLVIIPHSIVDPNIYVCMPLPLHMAPSLHLSKAKED